MNHNPLKPLIAAVLLLVALPAAAADFDAAMGYFRSGKYLEAAAEFQALVDEAPAYDFGYYMLGLSLMQMRKPGDAEANLLKAIEHNGERFEYHHALAKSYYDRGDYSKAISSLNNAEALATDDRMKQALYALRGYAYAADERWSDTIEDLEKARKFKSDATTLNQLGKAYFSLGYFDKALPIFREVLKTNANNPQTHQLLAEGLLGLGAEARSETDKKRYYAEALTESQQFLRLQPASRDARYLVGRAALGAGDYDRAIEAFGKVLEMKNDHCNAMANMGKALTAKQDWNNAVTSFDNATSCAPRMVVAWEGKGFALQKMGTESGDSVRKVRYWSDAIGAYQQAMSIKSSDTTRRAIQACQENIEVVRHNDAAAVAEAEQQQKIAAEQRRQEEEKKKREEWQKRRDDN